jgi:hypothetical protein
MSDIIDATTVYNNLKGNHPEWNIEFITPAIFAEVGRPTSSMLWSVICLLSAETGT